ncbi:MAG: rod shape-determining protein MreD [Chloroflexota bacterium]|nr:rod shape-determining protein MreD [Chloroflexota bacterium]
MSPWIVLILLAGLLQSTLISEFDLWGVHPNLVLTLVLGWSLLRGGREGLIWGLMGGVILDLYSVAPFGTFTIAMLVAALVTSLTEVLPIQATVLLSVGLMLVVSPLFHFVAMVMMESLGWDVAWRTMWVRLPPAALLDAVLILLLYRPLRQISHLAGERAIEWR